MDKANSVEAEYQRKLNKQRHMQSLSDYRQGLQAQAQNVNDSNTSLGHLM